MSSNPLLMANNKRRYINTRLWNDSFVADLDPSEKLLFVYFLTNEHSNLAGIYELPTKVIALETGIDAGMVKIILARLKDRVRYIKGNIVVRNHLKHQDLEVPNIFTNVLNTLNDLDKKWLETLVEKKLYHIPETLAERLSIGYPKDSKYSNLNLNPNINSKEPIVPSPAEPAPFDLKKEIEILEEHKRRAMQIIGLYLKQKKPDIRTKAQLGSAIKRHIKAATALEPFDDDQIIKGFRKSAQATSEWTIETAIKILTK